MVLSSLEYLYNDLIDNEGLYYKILVNDMMQETKMLIPGSATALNLFDTSSSSKLAVLQKLQTSLDPIEDLMDRLQKARNRKEKRRLLAEHNQQQELVWG